MTAHGRLVPHRPVLRAARLHVGTVVTERLDQVRDEPACATDGVDGSRFRHRDGPHRVLSH
jgi:hypothetical protein